MTCAACDAMRARRGDGRNPLRLPAHPSRERLLPAAPAYLWQRNKPDLLEEMVDSELEAILIEVAAMGLEPKKHLAKTLGMMHKPTSSCCRTCTGCTAAARAANSSPPPHPQRWGSTATSHFVLSCNCFHVQLLYHDTSIPRFCTRIPVLQMD